MVQGINTGRYWKHNADYPLQKKKIKKNYCKKCGKEISGTAILCAKCYKDYRLINMPDKNVLINDLYNNNGNFTKVGKKYNVSDSCVKKWCVKYNIPNKSSDYKFKSNKEKIRCHKIEIIQLDKHTDEEINRFDSIADAINFLKLKCNCGSHISGVCKGKRKTAYGYKWKYAI